MYIISANNAGAQTITATYGNDHGKGTTVTFMFDVN
jgi:hypothetical protein